MEAPQSNRYTVRVLEAIKHSMPAILPLWQDESIDEIQVNAPDNVFVRKRGIDTPVPIHLPEGQIRSAFNFLSSYNEKVTGERSKLYILSARLPGFRVEAMIPPVSVRGPSMCIRRHASRVVSLEEYVNSGICTHEQAELIRHIVKSKTNFMVSGGTYSGKTTLVNAILALIPPEERLFVIEQVAELRIENPNFAQIECDPEQGVTAQRALTVAMRYSPHRVILGELRGGEAVDFLMACNTGHPGSCTTIHADSAIDAIARLEDLVLGASKMPFSALRARIGNSVSWVIQIQMEGGSRKIKEIVKVNGYNREEDSYEFEDVTEGVKR